MDTTNRDEWEQVGPYRIQDRIGSGGYAEVFSGIDTRNGQRVALKRLRLKHLDDADSRERFRREGLALEAIDHPNIVRCFGILVQEDEVWIVMELLKGFTLRQFLRDRGPLSVERALLIAIDVADGLADMHEMAIVHRDLKPENVFLSMPGFQVKVVDLGVAKFHGWSTPTTDPGMIVCTPSYAAPEMSYGYVVDARSDIYALGLVLYEMLVGKNPFANGDGTLPQGQDALTAHIVRTPPPVSSRRADVPELVTALVAQMLDKDPTGRPPAMKVVARELRRALRSLRQPRRAPSEPLSTHDGAAGGPKPRAPSEPWTPSESLVRPASELFGQASPELFGRAPSELARHAPSEPSFIHDGTAGGPKPRAPSEPRPSSEAFVHDGPTSSPRARGASEPFARDGAAGGLKPRALAEPMGPAYGGSSAGAATAVALPARDPRPLFLLPPVAAQDEPDTWGAHAPAAFSAAHPVRVPDPTPVLELRRPRPRRAMAPAPVPAPAPAPRAQYRSALGLVMFGTMLIGGACGAVLSVRFWNLAHAPSASSLYALIIAGALAGTAGALLLQDREAGTGHTPLPRPSAWILAVGVAAGLLLGAAATWLFVAPLPAAPQPAHRVLQRPS